MKTRDKNLLSHPFYEINSFSDDTDDMPLLYVQDRDEALDIARKQAIYRSIWSVVLCHAQTGTLPSVVARYLP